MESSLFTGGFNPNHGKRLSTTDILKNDGTTIQGPDLPNERVYHCHVSYKDTIFIIGKLCYNHYLEKFLKYQSLLRRRIILFPTLADVSRH